MAHIPKGESKEEEILTFEQALKQSEDGENYGGEWIYVPALYSEYRYILGTKGKNPLITIGINPSTASPQCLDNTVRSVERIAGGNGYDSYIMFNIYAQRATKPDDMDCFFHEKLHEENKKAFQWLMEAYDSPAIWAAWGTMIEKREYLSRCLQDIVEISSKYGAKWYRTGELSKKGHPHHPLYLRKDSKLETFPIYEYVERFCL